MPHGYDIQDHRLTGLRTIHRLKSQLGAFLAAAICIGHYALQGTAFENVEFGGILLLAAVQFIPNPNSRARVGLDTLITLTERTLKRARRQNRGMGLVLMQIDGHADVYRHYEPTQLRQIEGAIRSRTKGIAPEGSDIVQIEQGVFGVALPPNETLNLETLLTLSKCIQKRAAEPIPLQHGEAQISLSIGACLSSRLRDPAAEELLEGARAALVEASTHGPEAIRSYSDLTRARECRRSGLLAELDDAIAAGQLRAHFQPQISALTGDLSGFEALIRWHHPERGLIPPAEFLPLLERSGDMVKVSMIMISQSLQALKHWEARGVHVPRVGVNFSTPELKNCGLLDHIKFELERYNMAPDRIAIEVLETVVAGHEDETIVQNLAGLADMGSCIDLDDFGTGHASITNIQRFSIERIKIDRSFIKGIDQDLEQQNMVAAILTMAERLGLSTLAEGVESEAERKLLTDLGCAHLQGFGIGRPMSFEDSLSWISAFYQSGNQPEQRRTHTN